MRYPRTGTVAAVVLVLTAVAGAQDWPTVAVPDPERSAGDVSLIIAAAALGDAVAQYLVANWSWYDADTDVEQTMRWYRRAAEQGLAVAQVMLGWVYAQGFSEEASIVIEPDAVEAARWYRRAAEQGLAEAQYVLGVMYTGGEGVPQDIAEAARWTRLAAEQGHTAAQITIAVLYATGKGVPQDWVLAYAWWNVAAASDDEARDLRDEAAELMTAAQVAEGQRIARELWESTEAARRAAPDPLTIQTPAPSGWAHEQREAVLSTLADIVQGSRGAGGDQ